MNDFRFITILFFTLILRKSISVTPNRPNIVMFFPDDMGYNDVSFTNGVDHVPFEQPFLDKLAAESVQFSTYYSASICTPSRCALMTGRYNIRTGCQSFDLLNEIPWGIGLDEYLLPMMLKDAGYYNVLYGKWHLGHYADHYLPTARGFDEFLGYCGGAEDHYSHFDDGGPPDYSPLVYDWWCGLPDENGELQPAKPDYQLKYSGRYGTLVWNETMWDFVTHRSLNLDSPWFMFLSSQLPHGPPQAPQKYADRGCNGTDTCGDPHSEYANWLGMEYLLNDYIKSVIDALRISGQVNRTIFIFIGDHGSPAIGDFMPANITTQIPNYSRNYPFRGGKGIEYEGGVRCPAFIWSPLLPENMRGQILPDIISVMDWFPTIATWVKSRSNNFPAIIDGIDLTDRLFNGAKMKQRTILINLNTDCQEYGYVPLTALRYQIGSIDVKLVIDCMDADGNTEGNISLWNMSYDQRELDENDLMRDKNWLKENDKIVNTSFEILYDYLAQSVPPMHPILPWQEGSPCSNCFLGCPIPQTTPILDQEDESQTGISYLVLTPWYKSINGKNVLIQDWCEENSYSNRSNTTLIIIISFSAVVLFLLVPLFCYLVYRSKNKKNVGSAGFNLLKVEESQ